ncbi:hypothetical protein D3C76_431270 [compost metagenome]
MGQHRARHAEPLAQISESLLDARQIRLDFAAGEALRIDAAGDQVGIGGSRCLAAAPVGNWPGCRAGAVRTDAQAACRIDPGNAAAAITDFDDIHHRRHDRVTGAGWSLLDHVVIADLHLPPVDQRTLGGRTADIQRQQFGFADQPTVCLSTEHSADRAGLHQTDRVGFRRLHGRNAAVGLHDVRSMPQAVERQVMLQVVEIISGRRHHVGGQHGGIAPLVLAPPTAYLMRRNHCDFRPELTDGIGEPLLVFGIAVGMQQADGDGFHPCSAQVVEQRGQLVQRQRRDDLAAIVQALGHFKAQLARHEGRRLAVVRVEDIGGVAARDFQHIAKSTRGDQGGLHPLALGQGVDHHRRAVGEESDVGIGDAALGHGIEQALLEVRRRGIGLDGTHHAILQIDQVGKGATDIGGDADCHGVLRLQGHSASGARRRPALEHQKVWDTVKMKRPSLRRNSPLLWKRPDRSVSTQLTLVSKTPKVRLKAISQLLYSWAPVMSDFW